MLKLKKNITNKCKIMGLLIKILSILTINVSAIWAVVSFLIYLVKDKEFNWWSIWLIIIGFVVFFCVICV
jgi:undecaprenyl pyrophosphate phosphatase UppP